MGAEGHGEEKRWSGNNKHGGREGRQAQNEGKYSAASQTEWWQGMQWELEVLLCYLIWVKWANISLNWHIFSRLRQGRFWCFSFILWCLFSIQKLQWFNFLFLFSFFFFSNYLDLAFPLPIWSLSEQEWIPSLQSPYVISMEWSQIT